MSINIIINKILLSLKDQNFIGGGLTDSIFEIGEQNWSGDMSTVDCLEQLINKYIKPKDKNYFNEKLKLIKSIPDNHIILSFDIVKIYYKIIFDYKLYKAIDFHGTKNCLKKDLNYPYSENLTYDVITNFGTTEHIFNQYEVFKTIHNLVKPNGYILHCLPYHGVYNHGFYNYNPTFFFDLARINDYKIIGLWITTTSMIHNIHNIDEYNLFLKKNTHPKKCYIFVFFKGSSDYTKEFIIPQQGIYFDKNISKTSRELWDKNK